MTDCKETLKRDPCALCALKHVGQARALSLELRKGYSHFFWFALGHLGEAEDELLGNDEALANMVRDARKSWELDPMSPPNWRHLVTVISRQSGYDLDLEFEIQGKETPDGTEHTAMGRTAGL